KHIEPLVDTKHSRFLAVKVIERDVLFQTHITETIEKIVSDLEKKYLRDMEQVIADERYRYIEMVRDEAVDAKKDLLTTTDKLDNIFLNRYLAIPIFMMIMFGVYYLAAGPIGGWTVELVDGFIGGLGEWMQTFLESVYASPWAVSLVVDGMIAGVGAMMNFLPQLIIFIYLDFSFRDNRIYGQNCIFF
ncbi:MAG: hypothetical protein LRY20_01650, partial [Acholeplasmataceae bacterium]|nr:hypothetical protein [Acholeplasmataceae bacterium]